MRLKLQRIFNFVCMLLLFLLIIVCNFGVYPLTMAVFNSDYEMDGKCKILSQMFIIYSWFLIFYILFLFLS